MIFFYIQLTFQSMYKSTEILSKDSARATIWLHFLRQNKNCNQEFVQSPFKVHIDYCNSNYYIELCSRTTE